MRATLKLPAMRRDEMLQLFRKLTGTEPTAAERKSLLSRRSKSCLRRPRGKN